MLSDNVLISSFIFFITCGVVWLIISRIEKSNLSPRIKRVLSYGCFAIIFAVIFALIVFIFNHHSENYLALNT